jgi:hypothetical protein
MRGVHFVCRWLRGGPRSKAPPTARGAPPGRSQVLRPVQTRRAHAPHLTVPSSAHVAAVNLSVGCHTPPVQPLTCPLVFFRSRMYGSPRTHSPRSRPSLRAHTRSVRVGCV